MEKVYLVNRISGDESEWNEVTMKVFRKREDAVAYSVKFEKTIRKLISFYNALEIRINVLREASPDYLLLTSIKYQSVEDFSAMIIRESELL